MSTPPQAVQLVYQFYQLGGQKHAKVSTHSTCAAGVQGLYGPHFPKISPPQMTTKLRFAVLDLAAWANARVNFVVQ